LGSCASVGFFAESVELWTICDVYSERGTAVSGTPTGTAVFKNGATNAVAFPFVTTTVPPVASLIGSLLA